MCYRAYYAIRSLSNSRGEATNAIYGFVTMIRKLVEEQAPDYLGICFDLKGGSAARNELFKDYKAHRKPMPDDLGEQLEPIKAFCRAFHYATFEKQGYEADDLIGTLALQAEKKGFEVLIATGDKDALQLVNDNIRILNPNKDNALIDAQEVRKRFDGLGPEKVLELMALMGDSSDNIPGVPGIGEKTAVRLIKEFGSIENLLKHVTKITSKKQQELLKEHADSARMSRELAQLDTKVPVDFEWDQIKPGAPDRETLLDLLKRYEFKTLLKQWMPEGESAAVERHYQIIRTKKELSDLVQTLKKAKAFSFDTETTSVDPMRAVLVGLSFSWKMCHAAYVPVATKEHQGEGLPLADVLEALRPVLEDAALQKYGQNIKYDWIVLKRAGITVQGLAFDTMIASYLINPVKFNHNLDDITLEYLAFKKIPTASLIGQGAAQKTMDQAPLADVAVYANEDADCVFRLVPLLKKELEQKGLEKLFAEVEMPLMEVLAKMEMNGVHLDLKFLKKFSGSVAADLEKLCQNIYREAGEEFNINSTKQLAEILFTKLKLPVVRKTKTGYSTDVSVLEKLAESYELPKMLLGYREKSKLKSTYLDALPEMVHPETGLIHTSYNQATTATGRLSSSDPNLQNIPIKTEEGRQIRKGFVPRERKKGSGRILSADYSQIELRILAHFSDDKQLMEAFQKDRDIHNFTATLLYGIPEKEVTREMRTVAKTINFSIIYGKTAFGLSQDLKISIAEADGFIEAYFTRYAGVKKYLEAQKAKAHEHGYLTTLLGRRAYFPEINSSNIQKRQFAERAAINAPIQGTAADLIKLAMIRIQARLEKDFPETLMVMQVHDELVFDVPEAKTDAVIELVKKEMEEAHSLKVPLRVDFNLGDSWYKN